MQDSFQACTFFNYILPIVQGLSPLELGKFLLNYLFLSKCWDGFMSNSVTALVCYRKGTEWAHNCRNTGTV